MNAGRRRGGLEPMMFLLLNERALFDSASGPMRPRGSGAPSTGARTGAPARRTGRRWQRLALAALVASGLGAAPGDVRAQGSVQTDRAALEALYNATDGANWTIRTNWLTAAPLGSWYGVETDEDGRVTELELGYWDSVLEEPVGNGLNGSIPPELGNLSRLRYLRLYGHEHRGPEAEADSARVLTGPIPDALSALTGLMSLDFGHNDLTGPIPTWLGSMTDLGLLHLGGNALSGSIPNELRNLTRLEWLSLWGNSFTEGEPMPAWLGTLTNLRSLDLGGHNFAAGEIPDWLLNLSNLDSLHLWDNNLTGPIPTWLGSLTELRWLSLGGNSLTGTISSSLVVLSNLEGLSLGGNPFTAGAIPDWLVSLDNLRELHLWDAQLTGTIPDWLGSLEHLEYLNLSSNQLTGTTPSSLATLDDLQGLWLGGNELSGAIPSALASLDNLRSLSLCCNQFSGSVPSWLGSLDGLKYLNLHDNQLTEPFPSSLTALSLEEFSLDICVPPLYQDWVATIPYFHGTVCGALPHVAGFAPRWSGAGWGPEVGEAAASRGGR